VGEERGAVEKMIGGVEDWGVQVDVGGKITDSGE